MSVLIKGMKMPEKCGKCRFATAFECQVTKNFITTFNVRQADCTLIPIPPHGRLIDADDFIKRITGLVQKAEDDDFALGAAWYETFIRHIELAPTIIPAEECEQ